MKEFHRQLEGGPCSSHPHLFHPYNLKLDILANGCCWIVMFLGEWHFIRDIFDGPGFVESADARVWGRTREHPATIQHLQNLQSFCDYFCQSILWFTTRPTEKVLESKLSKVDAKLVCKSAGQYDILTGAWKGTSNTIPITLCHRTSLEVFQGFSPVWKFKKLVILRLQLDYYKTKQNKLKYCNIVDLVLAERDVLFQCIIFKND